MRTAFFTAFWAILFGFALICTPVSAQTDIFVVEGVEVDVTAENALQAREQAFAQAQVSAFTILAGRMLSEAQLEGFGNLDTLHAGSTLALARTGPYTGC